MSIEAGVERSDSFARGSINSRGTFNKKNLSILLPEDEPGTEFNAGFKTPAIDVKIDELSQN